MVRVVRVASRSLRRLARDPAFWRPIRWCYWTGLKLVIGAALLLAMHMSSQTFKY